MPRCENTLSFIYKMRFEPGLKEAAEAKLKIISGNYLKRRRHARGREDLFKKALCAKITRRRWVSNCRFLNARVVRQRRVAESRRSSDREVERGGSQALSGLDNDIKWTQLQMCAGEGHLKKTNPNSCRCLSTRPGGSLIQPLWNSSALIHWAFYTAI